MNIKQLFEQQIQGGATDNWFYGTENTHYVFRPMAREVDDSNMDLTQARAVIDFIKGL